MQFQNIHLLSNDSLKTLIDCRFPNERAEIITKQLKYYILINKSKVYEYSFDFVYYTEFECNSDQLITIVSLYIEKSFKSLDKTDQDSLNYRLKNQNILSNRNITEYLPQIKTQLTNNTINFSDPQFNQINFRNGTYDIKTKLFRKRIFEKDFVSVYINRDYKKTTKTNRKNVIDVISKIYSKKDDRMYLLQTLGIALTGQSTIDQTMLFLLGVGVWPYPRSFCSGFRLCFLLGNCYKGFVAV